MSDETTPSPACLGPEPMSADRLAEIREVLTGAGPSIPMGPNALFALHKDRDTNRSAAVELLAEVDRLGALWAAVAKTSRDRKAEADGRRQHAEQLEAENEQLRARVDELEPFEPQLREMNMGPGGWSMTIEQAKSASGGFVAAAKAMLDGHNAENYVEQEVFLGQTKERYVIIYVRPGKKGPHQLRQEADAKVTSLLHDMATVARHIEDGEYGDADKAARQALDIAPGVDLPGR